MNDILKHFPASSTNNARSIVRSLIERFQSKPSYGLLKKLERMGIGADYTEGGAHDISNPESVHLLAQTSGEPVTDEDLAKYL